jgi:hypothetical protein
MLMASNGSRSFFPKYNSSATHQKPLFFGGVAPKRGEARLSEPWNTMSLKFVLNHHCDDQVAFRCVKSSTSSILFVTQNGLQPGRGRESFRPIPYNCRTFEDKMARHEQTQICGSFVTPRTTQNTLVEQVCSRYYGHRSHA